MRHAELLRHERHSILMGSVAAATQICDSLGVELWVTAAGYEHLETNLGRVGHVTIAGLVTNNAHLIG